jgi:hypothetical protein
MNCLHSCDISLLECQKGRGTSPVGVPVLEAFSLWRFDQEIPKEGSNQSYIYVTMSVRHS